MQPDYLINVKLDVILPQFVVLTTKNDADLVTLSTITQMVPFVYEYKVYMYHVDYFPV